MRIAGIAILVLAIAIAAVPQVTDCTSHGRMITTATGAQIHMQCHWTARAELALAVPLAAVGGLLALRRRGDGRNLGSLGVLLGAAVVAVPTALIGVCANNMMLCNSLMKPALIMMGVLVMVASLAALVSGWRPSQPVPAAG